MLPQIRHAAASQRLHLEDAPVVLVWRQALRGVERRGTRRPVRHEGDYHGMCRRYAPHDVLCCRLPSFTSTMEVCTVLLRTPPSRTQNTNVACSRVSSFRGRVEGLQVNVTRATAVQLSRKHTRASRGDIRTPDKLFSGNNSGRYTRTFVDHRRQCNLNLRRCFISHSCH
jgi:hypothetical protein